MSTGLGYINDKHFNRFWDGGDRGCCLQITNQSGDGYVQFTASELIAALPMIKNVIDMELKRKQKETIQAIEKNQDLLKTIVRDMRDISEMAINQPVFDMAALLSLGKTDVVLDEDY